MISRPPVSSHSPQAASSCSVPACWHLPSPELVAVWLISALGGNLSKEEPLDDKPQLPGKNRNDEPTEQQREAADDSAGVLRDRAEGKWKMKTLGPMDERRAIRLEVRRFGRYGEQRLISVGSAAAVKISDM